MLKTIHLCLLVIVAGVGTTFAQKPNLRGMHLQAAPINSQLDGDAYFTGTRTPQLPASKNNHKNMVAGSYGTQIGKTYYDLQTNFSIANRIYRNPTDNTISVVWTETCDPSAAAGFPNRGIGYNYWNGTTWIHGATANNREFTGTCNEPAGANGPNFGIASNRVGWPEIMHVGTAAPFKEVVLSHNSSAINMTSRNPKGTGGMNSWSATRDLTFTQNIMQATLGAGVAGSWLRAQASGNNIHMVYALNKTVATGSPAEPTINGVTNPMVYSRSTDGGLTWDKQNVFLPGMEGIRNSATPTAINPEGFNRIGGDGYAIAVKGNTVAIVAGYFGNAWTLWKSTDNGNTFTRRVIHKISAADTLIINTAADTVALTNDNAHALVIDNAGVVHVFAGQVLVKVKTNAGGTIFTAGDSWYPSTFPSAFGNGLLYWNDAMPAGAKPTVVAEIEKINPPCAVAQPGNGKYTPYGVMGMVSMASAAVDAANNIYVAYTAAVECTSNNGAHDGQPYRDIYVIKRFGTGANTGKWSKTVNVARSVSIPGFAPGSSTAENSEESVFPAVVHEVMGDSILHMTFQSDLEPGTNVGPDNDPEHENKIMYYGFPVTNLTLRLLATKKEMNSSLNRVSAFPNPTNGSFKIAVDLKQNANVQVRVMNALGQEVTSIAPSAMAAGKNEVSVDMANLAAGVYMYTVTSDNFTVTQRIVKK